MSKLSARMDAIFRKNPSAALRISDLIRKYVDRLRSRGRDNVRIMNFCGTHEWTTVHYGLRSMVPKEVDMVAGPGCPVCVTPSAYVEAAVGLAMSGVRVYTYGDAYRLPSARAREGIRSLSDAKAKGGDVKLVYSFLDAVKDASSAGCESVFLGIGFETVFPSYAALIRNGRLPGGMYFLSSGRLTPPAARFLMERGVPLDGVIAPGHVSAVIGAREWEFLPSEYKVPAVISGFEPIDVLLSVAEILRQLSRGDAEVVVEYSRAVRWDGNTLAKSMIKEVFEVCLSHWRGLGPIPQSGYSLNERYRGFDAAVKFKLDLKGAEASEDVPAGCMCAGVISGINKPSECPLFMVACTPQSPYGPCMVSSEGACSVWAQHGLHLKEAFGAQTQGDV